MTNSTNNETRLNKLRELLNKSNLTNEHYSTLVDYFDGSIIEINDVDFWLHNIKFYTISEAKTILTFLYSGNIDVNSFDDDKLFDFISDHVSCCFIVNDGFLISK